MADRGGIRVGSARPAGSKNKATADIKEGLSGLAKNHIVEALGVIVELMHNSMNDNVRLAAACSLLDRGYGKPSITQVDNSTGHVITAFEVVADCLGEMHRTY
jgi:hypothetical protein